MISRRLDDINRTELFFTATLLPYALIDSDFGGLRKLVGLLKSKGLIPRRHADGVRSSELWNLDWSHPEIAPELYVIRDSKEAQLLNADQFARSKSLGESVPDLVVVIPPLRIAVEGKFFDQSRPNLGELNKQIQKQSKVLRLVFENRCDVTGIMHIALLPEDQERGVCADGVLTWTEVANLSESQLGHQHYVTERLQHAVKRWDHEFGDPDVNPLHNFDGTDKIDGILDRCRIHGAAIQIGFEKGRPKFERDSLEYLQKRTYKFRITGSNLGHATGRNWIDGDIFLEVATTVHWPWKK